MSKLCPKCQYFVGAPLLSSTALILLGMEFTRAAQVVAGILFHSSIMTSRSCWMLDTWCFSTFRLRMPHMCLIGFRSGDILGHSITFTFTFSSKAVVILAVCLGWLLCWKTVSEGRASSSASECHSTCWNPCFLQCTAAPQYQNFWTIPSPSCSSCPGGWSQMILEVKMLDVEVLGWCGYTWSAVVRPVGCTAKFSETPLETAYGREMNIQFTGNSSGGHSCSQHANCTLPQNLRHLWHCAVW